MDARGARSRTSRPVIGSADVSENAPAARLSLVGASVGDPTNPRTASGAARYLLAALARQHDLLDTVDYALHGVARIAVATASFHPSKQRWRQRYHLNRAAHRLRSRNLHKALEGVGQPFDLAVLVFGWANPWRGRHVLYLDQTWRMMQAYWPPDLPPEGPFRYLAAAERSAVRAAAHVFTMTEAAARSIVDDYGVAARRVTAVGGGFNFDCMPDVERNEPNKTILFVGRDFKRKGGDVLVTAFRRVRERLPEARLLIAGVGTDQVERCPGVEALGIVTDRTGLAKLYADASVFCLPSRYEPYGFALVEAMAFGLPCVAAHGVASHEIVVPGKTGILVRPGDIEELADALTHLLEHRDRAKAMGRAGRRRVENELNWDRVVKRMEPGLWVAAQDQG